MKRKRALRTRARPRSRRGLWHQSPYIEDDIAQYFSALAEFMCQGGVTQRQASSHRVDQPVALEERTELGKAGVAIGSTQIVDEKKPKRDRVAH
jgi:hypothetical protein